MNIFRHHITHITSGWLRKTIIPIIAVSLTVITAACGRDESVFYSEPDEPLAVEKANVYLTLNISVSDNIGSHSRSLTRAVDDKYYFEQPVLPTEKLHELRVIIVRENNTIEAHRKVDYDKDQEVLRTGEITFKLTSGPKRIYLIGNESSLPADVQGFIKDGGNEITPYFLDSDVLTRPAAQPFYRADEYIPMTEKFDIYLPAKQHDEVEDPEDYESNDEITYVYKDLFVTRLATKYTFTTPDDYSSLKIKLHDIATRQYLFPHSTVYSPGKYEPAEVIEGVPGHAIIAFSTPENDVKADYEVELTGKTPVFDNSGNFLHYRYDPIYLMETSGTSFSMTALVDGHLGVVGDYDYSSAWFEPKQFDNLPLLPRNTHVIVNLSARGDLDCTVDLLPYRSCTLDPVFGLGDVSKPATPDDSKDDNNNTES